MGAVSVPKINVILNLICYQYGYLDTEVENGTTALSTSGGIGQDHTQCQNAEVHAILAKLMLWAHVISGTLCAFTSPRLGALSDKYGRNRLIAISATGMLLGDIITLMAASFPDHIPVHWILTEYAFGGLAGSFITTMAIMQSYTADCTSETYRSASFGYLHGCMYTGISLGPILGGIIIKASGNILTIFYVAFVCHFCFICFILTVVPESLPKESQHAARDQRASSDKNPWRLFINILNIFRPLKIFLPSSSSQKQDRNPSTRRNIILLPAIDAIVFGVTLGSASLVVMYSEYRFHWDTFAATLFVSIANSCRVAMLVLVLPIFTYLWTRHGRLHTGSSQVEQASSDRMDFIVIRIAILFDILAYIGYALSASGSLFILSGVIASIGGVASPTAQASLTTHFASERTGELMGAVSLLHALSRVAVPAVLHALYAVTIGKASNAIFWCLAGVFGAAAAASWGLRLRSRGPGYEVVETSE